MRLATLDDGNGVTVAVVVDAAGRRSAPVDGYADIGALLRDDPRGLEAARAVDPAGDAGSELDVTRLRAPVLSPGAVVCVGLNYRSHINEMGRELPTDPTLFSKLARALTGPYDDVELPPASTRVDYEGELAVVIGTGGRDIAREQAWDHVAGATVINDVTMRDFQRRTVQWFAGKTWQGSTPMGPWVVTPDELGGLDAWALTLTVNGVQRQRSALGDLVFDVPALIADLSTIVALEPGDVIATGTPGGVGDASGSYLADGDVVEVVVEGVGSLRTTFRRRR